MSLDVIGGAAGCDRRALRASTAGSAAIATSTKRAAAASTSSRTRIAASDGWSWTTDAVHTGRPQQNDLDRLLARRRRNRAWRCSSCTRAPASSASGTAAERGFAYERKHFSAEQQNWPDFRFVRIAESAAAGRSLARLVPRRARHRPLAPPRVRSSPSDETYRREARSRAAGDAIAPLSMPPTPPRTSPSATASAATRSCSSIAADVVRRRAIARSRKRRRPRHPGRPRPAQPLALRRPRRRRDPRPHARHRRHRLVLPATARPERALGVVDGVT